MTLPTSANRPLMPVFDGHNDILLSLHAAERGKGRSFFTRSDIGHVDLPRARLGGLAGGFFGIFVPAPTGFAAGVADSPAITRTENGYAVPLAASIDPTYAADYTRVVVQELFDLEAASGGEVQVVRDADQLRQCLSSGALKMENRLRSTTSRGCAPSASSGAVPTHSVGACHSSIHPRRTPGLG
jgi:membrane dipeptidase